MLVVLLTNAADRHYLWGPGAAWVGTGLANRGGIEEFAWLFPPDLMAFDIVYALTIGLAVLYLFGWRTRFVLPILLAFWLGLLAHNPLATHSGDTLLKITLLFALFANLNTHFSVDSWLRRRTASSAAIPAPPGRQRRVVGAWLHNTALVLCCYQLILVYLVSSIYKLASPQWLEGSALFVALSLDQFQPFPVFSEIAWQVTPLIQLATWFALFGQLLFPILLIWRSTRYIAIVVLAFMHIGIGVLMGLWSFSLTSLALDFLFVRDSSWRALGRRFSRLSRSVQAWLSEEGPPSDMAVQADRPKDSANPVQRREAKHPPYDNAEGTGEQQSRYN